MVLPFLVFSSSKSSNSSKKKTPHFVISLLFFFNITFLIKMSLYYTITNRIKFELLTLAFNVLQYPANIHFSPTRYSNFFSTFLILRLPGISSLNLSVYPSLYFPSYKSFNTLLFYLPRIWPKIILPSYVGVLQP